MEQPGQPKPSLNVFIPEHLRNGAHSNVVSVTTTEEKEVILDFVFSHPQESKDGIRSGVLVSRVVLPISVAQKLLVILESHLGKPKTDK